jgi:PKD repeat protein
MKKITLVVFALSLVCIAIFKAIPNEQEKLAAILETLPYNQRQPISESELKAIAKLDRPDLAMERDFLMTMNPELKRPTPEVLLPTIKQVNDYKKSFAAKTLPGSELEQAKWTERGPFDYGGRTRAIMFDPNDVTHKRVFAGGVGGGLWYTNDITNNDTAWQNVSDMWANMAVTAIDYDKSNSQIMYVGTGEGWGNADAIRGLGVWKSIDGGNTWNQLASTNGGSFRIIQALAVHPITNALLVGTSNGLFKSTNGGSTFTNILSGFISDITFSANGYMYIGTGNSNSAGKILGSSTDGIPFKVLSGNGLSNGSDIGRTQISTAPSADSVVYVLTAHSSTRDVEGIYKSTNYGNSWVKLTMPTWSGGGNFARGQAWYDLISCVSPVDENVVFVGGVDLFRSSNGGDTWSQISYWNANRTSSFYVHADHHELVFVPGSDSLLLSGSDGGLSITNNLGTTWETRNYHYNVTQFYAVGIHPGAGNNTYLSGAQDNGTILVEPTNVDGRSVNGGDGAYCFIDQDQPQYAFVSSQYGNFNRLLNWSYNGSVIGGSTGDFINPGDYDDKENILYSVIATNANSINRITNATGSVNRELLSVSGLPGKVSTIMVSPYSDDGKSDIFIGTQAGGVAFIENAHDDDTQSLTNLFVPGAGYVSSIDIGASVNEVLVTRSNYGVVSVYYTSNFGDTWIDIEGNLPDLPVRGGLFNPSNRKEVILATEVGIWGAKDITANNVIWTPHVNGFANVRVDMLQYRTSDNQVLATTHGRGMFTSDAFAIIDTLVVDFTADVNYVNPGESVSFQNKTNGSADEFNWEFEGAEITNYTGETPPSIRYVNSGVYKVKLTATKDTSEFVNEKEYYITVRPTECTTRFSYNVGQDTVYSIIPISSAANFEITFIDNDSLQVDNGLASQGYNSNWIVKLLNGSYVYAATSRFQSSAKADNWIILGPLSIGDEKTIFAWQHIMAINSLRDGYEVYVSNSGRDIDDFLGSGINLKKFKDNDVNSTGNTSLTYHEVELPFEMLGNEVYFGFRHNAEHMTVLGLDEFELIACSETPALAPVADFKGDSLNIKIGETVNFTDLSTNFATSWSWDFEDGTGDKSLQNPTVTFETPGCKKITLWAYNEIGSDSTSKSCYIDVLDNTDVNELNVADVTKVYPNPFNNQFHVISEPNATIRVFDAAGREMLLAKLKGKALVNTNNWSSGLYFMETIYAGQRHIKKLIKE